MYIITLILELTPETNHEEIMEFYEEKIASSSLLIPEIEKINCLQLRSTPFNQYDQTPLRNLFYQVQIFFSSEEAVDQALKRPKTLKLLQRFMIFSKCKFHWFVGHEKTFVAEDFKIQAESS
ncbi:hypothetical protein MK805_06180 [Shimazuella sp. AN120528]|uniref:hypothetical protein n=1 Tax=Shimazuella soli TaxID=1892854 RepID=UPI001F0D3140|nr:hypothetical protein [Shimazuella soli]MCH5584556.1 hypothetical protein [Shimazuella soli]